ncbi:MAG: cell division topological specificity factor MinE [Clostridia bacterium]|nr:cell division topological specificity factor MinE [Clostridia bacterium]
MSLTKRLKSVLVGGKEFYKKDLNEILKSEVFKCASEYLEIYQDNIKTNLEINENGEYVFRCKICAKRLKLVGLLPSED